MSYLSSLQLQYFRNYQSESVEDLRSGLLVFYGANGAGKTNILEAVSLLTPGRGLRKAKPAEISNARENKDWSVFGSVDNEGITHRIGVGLDDIKGRQKVRVNGANISSKTALSDYLSCVWLTPQMDGLFLGGAGDRRRFLDRMIYAFDPSHAGRLTRYENAMRQRSKILQDGGGDAVWLSGLEQQMAETGVAILATRLDFVAHLIEAGKKLKSEHFPQSDMVLVGDLEARFSQNPALETEEYFRKQLHDMRRQDAQYGGAVIGPHKSDLVVVYDAKKMPAEQCSTGEQKALLLGIILAHAQMIESRRGAPPLLLLDEIAAHLDEGRRAALFDILLPLRGQVWLTGTDRDLFSHIEGKAQFFEVADAKVTAR